VVNPCFISCNHPLQESFPFTIFLAYFHICLFVFICKLPLLPPCTNFVIPGVLVNDGICSSTADVQLISYISDSNLS